MDSKIVNSGGWFVRRSCPVGGRFRTPPPLSSYVRVYKHKVKTSQSGERRGDLSRFIVTTSTEDKNISDTTSMTKKSEQDKGPPQTPQNVMTQLDPQQQKSYSRLWSRIPEHLRIIWFGLDKAAWQSQDIGAVGDTLCEFEHRFSKHSTDLGHITLDPFRIVLKQDATPVKQKPYRHSPALAAKVRTRFDRLLLSDILHRSYSNWASPLVVVAKSGGRVWLTCSYKKINEQGVTPVLLLPVVDDLLSELGNSRVFSTTDLVSGFFKCAIDKDSISLTAVYIPKMDCGNGQ